MVAKKQHGTSLRVHTFPVVTRLHSSSLSVIGVGKHEALVTKQVVWV